MGNFRKNQEDSNVKGISLEESSITTTDIYTMEVIEAETRRGTAIIQLNNISSDSNNMNNRNNNNNMNRRHENSLYSSHQSLIGERGLLLGLLRRILHRDSVDITNLDPTLKVIYLGNVVTSWAKTEGCLERPASALWRNHSSGRGSIKMTVSVTPQGLKAQTAEHGLTEYWSNRLTWTGVPVDYPKLFCWIYRHEGRKLKQELRCHAVLCPTHEKAVGLATSLRNRLAEALFDFRREKILRQNARLSLVQSLYPQQVSCGYIHAQNNYKQPLEKARSAPKLTAIEELFEEPSNMETSLIEEDQDTCLPQELHEEGNHAEPSASSLNLPSLNSYSKVMLHLLESNSNQFDDQGSSNSDPVNENFCDSDSSQHGEQEEEEEEEEEREEFSEEINDDNISDESGYEEQTILNNNNKSSNNSNNSSTIDNHTNPNHSNNNNNKTKPSSSSLVLYDNLSFQI